jgi:hypothetical protein
LRTELSEQIFGLDAAIKSLQRQEHRNRFGQRGRPDYTEVSDGPNLED